MPDKANQKYPVDGTSPALKSSPVAAEIAKNNGSPMSEEAYTARIAEAANTVRRVATLLKPNEAADSSE